MDTKGNIGIILITNIGGGSPGAGVGGFVSVNNAPTVSDQEGLGTTVGGSGGPGLVAGGVEYNMLINTETGETYHGATLTAAFGLYPACAELHGEVGNTEVWDINIFDIIIYIASALSGGDN